MTKSVDIITARNADIAITQEMILAILRVYCHADTDYRQIGQGRGDCAKFHTDQAIFGDL